MDTNIFLAEFMGTMMLIILGDGVVANVVLNKSKAQNAGWIVITTGWGLAVAVSVYLVGQASGAHLNPAVTIALAYSGNPGVATFAQIASYIVAQMLGAFVGALIVWLHYLPHWRETECQETKLAVFCTAPAIRSTGSNLISEIIGTAVLVIGVLGITAEYNHLSSGLAPLLVGFLVWSIGLSLGGTTGYAINPARDLGPRLAHQLLPIANKGKSDWQYAWIPVVGPVIGGVLGAVVYQLLKSNVQFAS